MFTKICLVLFAVVVVSSEDRVKELEVQIGVQIQPSNYELSRQANQLGGGNYGHPGYYPGGGYYGNRPVGPPGAHPGCPLCDSSVYSYCSHKQAHDSCCCGNGFNIFSCRNTDCNFLYANSCQEYDLITNCCCVDLYKSSGQITPTDVI